MRHGNQLRQKQTSRQQHEAKGFTSVRVNGKLLEEVAVQILITDTNQRRNTNKGSTDQIGASTLNYDKAGNTVEGQDHRFPNKY